MCNNCREQNNNASNFILGAAFGAAVALMLAPFSGKKMRRVTKEKGKEKLNELKTRYQEFEEKSVKPNIEKAKQKGKELWDQKKDEMKGKRDDVLEEVEEAGDKIARKADEVKSRVRSIRIKTED